MDEWPMTSDYASAIPTVIGAETTREMSRDGYCCTVQIRIGKTVRILFGYGPTAAEAEVDVEKNFASMPAQELPI